MWCKKNFCLILKRCNANYWCNANFRCNANFNILKKSQFRISWYIKKIGKKNIYAMLKKYWNSWVKKNIKRTNFLLSHFAIWLTLLSIQFYKLLDLINFYFQFNFTNFLIDKFLLSIQFTNFLLCHVLRIISIHFIPTLDVTDNRNTVHNIKCHNGNHIIKNRSSNGNQHIRHITKNRFLNFRRALIMCLLREIRE